jgi:arginase
MRARRIVVNVSRWAVLGVPSSAGSYAAGQDLAPAALRAAGLVEALSNAGLDVHDEGDLPMQIWKPDREHPLAQNVEEVVACLQDLADRLGPLLANEGRVFVVGGNCTIALAVMDGLGRLGRSEPGMIYLDGHFDLNTPASTCDGALDWMGLAHAFALPGCVDALVDAFGRRPLLNSNQVAWLGVDAQQATEWELEQSRSLDLHVSSSEDFAANPVSAAVAALETLPPGPLALHIDVDVLDFIDSPLAENSDGRNTGPNLNQFAEALIPIASDPRLRAVSIGELNPTRSAGDPEAIPRFVGVLAAALGTTPRQ